MKQLTIVFLLIMMAQPSAAQQTGQNPSTMSDSNRPHPRIAQVDVPGRRIELTSLKGAVLFVGPKVKANKRVPLLIHFHGVPWLVQFHVAKHIPRAALITVNLGAGSGAYGNSFGQPELFQKILVEAEKVLEVKRGWSSINLVGFSAGYGAVRAILRREENFKRVDNILLLDGIHAGYSPKGKPPADGGAINAADLDSFINFAREAVAGKKTLVITHSEIFPGTYASTTECVDYLLSALGLEGKVELKNGPIGMQQLSAIDTKGLHIRGYAGNTAPDHVDHLQALSAWFRLLNIK